jgi:hypothetical protein
MKPPPYSHLKNQVAFVCIRAYAAHSYLYYEKNSSVISDGEFDALCKFLLDNYEWIKPFDLNDYLDKGSLEAGSGYAIASKVCGQTRGYALDLLKTEKKKPAKVKPKPVPVDVDGEEFDLIG